MPMAVAVFPAGAVSCFPSASALEFRAAFVLPGNKLGAAFVIRSVLGIHVIPLLVNSRDALLPIHHTSASA